MQTLDSINDAVAATALNDVSQINYQTHNSVITVIGRKDPKCLLYADNIQHIGSSSSFCRRSSPQLALQTVTAWYIFFNFSHFSPIQHISTVASHYQREPISISDCGSNSQPPLTRQPGWREQQTGEKNPGGDKGSGQLKWRDREREKEWNWKD